MTLPDGDDVFQQVIARKLAEGRHLSHIEQELLRQRRAQEDLEATLLAEIRACTESVEGLVRAWQTASGVVRFVKVLSILAGAATAVWGLLVLIKGGPPPVGPGNAP